ncbi:MAG: hypothetical protein SFU87_20605 [Chitinophagaceae bacterium]|nr:hypothetical protein [Chitinophagaceae bacterium]
MIKLQDLKVGDIVMVEFEGQMIDGDVTEISKGDKKACVLHGEQEFWYDWHDLHPVPLTEEQLVKLNFEVVDENTGSGNGQLYVRGPFSLKFLKKNNDTDILLTYRDEQRLLHESLYVHQLQNHYKGMTNFDLHR